MTPPVTKLSACVKAAFAAEFTPEGWTLADDKLPRAAGMAGDGFAVSPVSERQDPRHANVLIVTVMVQFYMAFEAEPDETIVVNPNVVAAFSDRLRRRLKLYPEALGVPDADLWYLHMIECGYPDDPTGNKSRFEATIEGRCENPAATPV